MWLRDAELAKRARSGTGVATALVRCGRLLRADQPQPAAVLWEPSELAVQLPRWAGADQATAAYWAGRSAVRGPALD